MVYKSIYSLSHDVFNPISEKDYKDAVTSSERLKAGRTELSDGTNVAVWLKDKVVLCKVT